MEPAAGGHRHNFGMDKPGHYQQVYRFPRTWQYSRTDKLPLQKREIRGQNDTD
jgi:hypothetical protein